MSHHAHGHHHHHDHGHHHSWRLGVALAITATILIAEVVGALLTGSLSLLVDAGHMLTDVAGLVIALVAATLMTRPTTAQLTWGWARMESIAAAVQATILLIVGGYAVLEGVRRLVSPPELSDVSLLLAFGILGLVGNIASMLVLSGGRDANLNMRAAFLEVLGDALGSVAVIVSAAVVLATGWTRADAIAGLIIALLIIPRALRILSQSLRVLLDAVPEGLDLVALREHLLTVPHVCDVHDLHASQLGTGLPILSAHVIIDDACFRDGQAPCVLDQLQACVAAWEPVPVEHATFQLEPAGHRDHEPGMHP